jgi:hypothetical protein
VNKRKSRLVRVKVEFPLVYDHDLESLPFDTCDLFSALYLEEVAEKLGGQYQAGSCSSRIKLSETKKDLDISDAWRKAQTKEER